MVRSVYLSVGRYDDPAEQERYSQELVLVKRAIREGGTINYELAELQRLRDQLHSVRSVSSAAIFGALFRLFLPAILFLAALYLLLYIIRR